MSVYLANKGENISLLAEGTVTADGSEQGVVEYLSIGRVAGYIDASGMASGDTVVVRQYARIADGGSFLKYKQETYSGASDDPALYVHSKESRWGIRVTIQQTAGTYREYGYSFVVER